MSKLKKTARKIANKTSETLSPIGHKLYRGDLSKKVEGTTDKYLWGEDPIDPATQTDAAAPMVMPMQDDTELAKARRKKIAAQRSRSGRMSTVLTDTDGLGG